jgi:PhnB protein
MAFYPYLNFPGTCREAFTRYHEIFGGDLTLLPFSDMPSDEPMPAEQAKRILHAALMLPDGGLLMASDTMGDDGTPKPQGLYVNGTFATVAEAEKAFAGLADGGAVEMPIGPTFFSPAYGICADRWGTPWMISAAADAPDAPASS